MSRRGITLLEMIVVMLILSMLMAFAVAVLRGATRNLAVPSAVTHVESMMRTGRHRARMNRSPVWMLFESSPRQISLLTKEVYAQWHLESDKGGITPGPFGRDAKLGGGSRGGGLQPADGKIGRCLRFRADSTLQGPDIPVWDPRQGFALEMWLYRDDSDAAQTIASIGSSVTISLERTRSEVRDCAGCGKAVAVRTLQCPLCGEKNKPVARGRTVAGTVVRAQLGKVRVQTPEPIPSLRWVHLAVMHAAGEARIYVDRVLLAAEKGQIEWGRPAPLVFGARSNGYRGLLDELSFHSILPIDVYALPPEVQVEFRGTDKPDSEGRFVLHIDRDGRLEPARHAQPVVMRMPGPDGQEEWLRFELDGSVGRIPPVPAAQPAAGAATGG